jgi:hypothetical protein
MPKTWPLIPCPHCGKVIRFPGNQNHARSCWTPQTLDRLLEIGGVDTTVGEDECWLWTRTQRGDVQEDRYPDFHTAKAYGHETRVHRLVWTLVNEQPIPPGMLIMHTCDRPPCCNPRHLRLATDAENMADMRAKGRAIFWGNKRS